MRNDIHYIANAHLSSVITTIAEVTAVTLYHMNEFT